MNPDDLSKLIAEDLQKNAASLSWYGRPIAECLCVPRKMEFVDNFNKDELVQLWLVFEEDPNIREGYKVIFSEVDKEFGLAVAGKKEPVLIGIYGGFVETLNSM